MQTITELPEYIKRAERLLSQQERWQLINFLAENPKAGALIQGTGGVRKLRWRRDNKGKSGGVRIIYYYHNEKMPLYLLTLFGKGEKANLSKAESNALAELVKVLVKHWRK